VASALASPGTCSAPTGTVIFGGHSTGNHVYIRDKTLTVNPGITIRGKSGTVEGINNKARVITKRAYGLKSADSLWSRLILDLNRASEAIGWSIQQLRQMVGGLKALFDSSCT